MSNSENNHVTIDPAILYFGTPVVLVSTSNPDGTANLAPMSSAWWLGRSCMLGFGSRSQTPANILRTGECVLNLPSVHEVTAVNRLARTTGSDPVPPHKAAMGYRHEANKFALAELTVMESDCVEMRIVRVHVSESIRMAGHTDRVDPELWRPLIMSFQQFFGLGEMVHDSTLARIPESAYRPKLAVTPPSVRMRDVAGATS